MLNSKRLLTWFIAGMLLTACQTMVKIPDAYNFTTKKEIKGNSYGCWMIVTFSTGQNPLVPDTIAGEFICTDADTLYLLVNDFQVQSIYSKSVVQAELFTHRNQTGTYTKATSFLLIPNFLGALIYISEYGGGFLALGIPVTIVGGATILMENLAHRNILLYPEKISLDKLELFARFPSGKPASIDFKQLTLKKSSKYLTRTD